MTGPEHAAFVYGGLAVIGMAILRGPEDYKVLGIMFLIVSGVSAVVYGVLAP